MTVLERILALKARVNALGDSQARFDEVNKLQDRKQEAQEVADELAAVAVNARLLRRLKIELPPPPASLEDVQARLQRIQERFANDGTAASLTRRNDWPHMITKVKETARTTNLSLSGAWKTYVKGLHTGDTPEHIRALLAPTDENAVELERYRVAYEELLRCASALPADVEQGKQAGEIAAELKKIDRRFDRDVPAAVKRFLDAVSQGNAGLDLASEDVRNWLRSKGSYAHYRITLVRS
jgi:hypothetical protein